MAADHGRHPDNTPLWIKERLPVLSRFRPWLFPALTATMFLIVIIVLGATNIKTSSRLRSMEHRVYDVVQAMNASLQHAEEKASAAEKLQFAVEANKEQLASVSAALQRLSSLDSLTRSVELLKCSLDHVINNSSMGDGCCPLGWVQFGSDCFLFSDSSLTWNESRTTCETRGAQLLVVQADKTWDFVVRRAAPELFWIGLSDWRTGRWEWVNRTPYIMDRRRWVPGQPDSWTGHGLGPGDEDCAQLNFRGLLVDVHCSKKERFICQKHSVRG